MDKKTDSRTAKELRRMAEEIGHENLAQSPESMEALSPEAARQVIHELRVHQIELEMQNEELRRTQESLEASRARYFDLYDLAPVGYLSISGTGLIMEANFSFSALVGQDRRVLLRKPMTRFIFPGDQDTYFLHRNILFETGIPQVCELRLVKSDGAARWIRLEINRTKNDDGEPLIRAVVSDIDDKKRMEEDLRGRESKYRQMFELEADALFLIDSGSGRILEANLAAAALYGYSNDELLGMSHVELSAEPEETEKATIDAGSAGRVRIPLRYHRKKDGTTFPVEINSTSLLWQGRPAIMPTIRDITERKQAEAALASSEAQLRTLVETIPDWVWLKKPDGTFLSCNSAFARFLGISQPDIVGKSDCDFVDEKMADHFREKDGLAIATGNPNVSEEWIPTGKNGSRILVESIRTPMVGADGALIGVLGIARDITRRKLAEEELRMSDEKHRKMIANISDVISIMDKEGFIRYMSPNIEKWFGWQSEELVGATGWGMVHPEDLTRIQHEFYNLLAEDNATKTVAYRYMCKEGSFKNIKMTAINLSNDPTVNGVLMNFRDITEELRSERLVQVAHERKRRSDLLNELVREGLPNELVLHGISRMLGNRITEPISCCLIVLDKYRNMQSRSAQEGVGEYPELVDSIIDVLEDANRIVWESPDGIGVISFGIAISEGIAGEQKKQAENLLQKITRKNANISISIGIGEISTTLDELDKRYRQAVTAVDIGCKLWPQRKTHHYLDLGIFQIVAHLNKDTPIESFVESTLGKLLHYENKKNVDFMPTLEILLLSENLKDSADKLEIHYQTLLYRKRRISEILGVSFEDPAARMAILTALYLRKLKMQ